MSQKILAAKTLLFQGLAVSVPGSTNLGTFSTGGYARFTGMFSATGSMTVQWQMGVASGNYQVTSSVVINSGPGTIFDQLSYGRHTNFTITAANSQAPTYFVSGEPMR